MKMNVTFSETRQDFGSNFSEGNQSFNADVGETTVLHDGQNGATFTPSVSPDGVISWTNDRELPNPAPVNIKGEKGERGEKGEQGIQGIQGIQGDKGEQGIQGVQGDKGDPGKDGTNGVDGKDGTPCTHRWDGTTLIVTSASGTSRANLKGDKGETGAAGADGKDGFTPTKGVDYYTPDEKQALYAELLEMIKNDVRAAKIGEVTLLASNWVGENNLYSQIVNIEGVTPNSQVDLTPDVQQLAVFYNKDISFVTENYGGVVTVYAIGQKPANDYTIQVTITEVDI